jgi:hypothetical protein
MGGLVPFVVLLLFGEPITLAVAALLIPLGGFLVRASIVRLPHLVR